MIMDARVKYETLRKAYDNARDWVKRADDGELPFCGDAMERVRRAEALVKEYGWLFDGSELPDRVFHFIR